MSIERRRHPRVEGEINANLLINNEINVETQVLDVSASGIAFEYDGEISIGANVIAHLDGGARLEGGVARIFKGGFAIELKLSEHKRQRLAETLDRAKARGRALDRLVLERRIASRIGAVRQSVVCETADKRIPVRIVDMSLTGIGIETEEDLELDSLVVIGKMRGSVVRRDGNRYGIEFLAGADCLEGAMDSMNAEPAPARRRAAG